MTISRLHKPACLLLILTIALSPVIGVSAGRTNSPNLSAVDNLPGGTPISVAITAPSDGALKVYPPGVINLEGVASVAEGTVIKDTTVVYVLDRSASMLNYAEIDCTGDGAIDSRAVCAQFGIATANEAAAEQQSSIGLTGVASFADTGSSHVVDLAVGGNALLVAPDYDGNGNSIPDIKDVVFTINSIGDTNYADGLKAAFNILNDSANTSAVNLVFFISDADEYSEMKGPNVSSVANKVPANTTIHTFGIGIGPSCSFGEDMTGSLDQIASLSTTGTGTCQIVTDISELDDKITETIGSELVSIERQLDGGDFVDISKSAVPSLPLAGPTGDVAFSEAGIPVEPGIHTLCVRANGIDSGGAGSVTDCIEVIVASIDLLPPEAVNELGVNPQQTHTVTALVAAGADGGVQDLAVDFEILTGPNAGATGSGITDGYGETTFTYTAVQGLAGLGIDVIEACFGPDEQGDSACDTATKEWVDTTPPAGMCSPTTNPSGRNVPPAGKNPKNGQNPDGFYILTATDLVDPNPQIFVYDSKSNFVAGPFASGTKIKLTQAPGAKPNMKPGSGVIQWHITLKGDAILKSVDVSSNMSAPVFCRMPPKPK